MVGLDNRGRESCFPETYHKFQNTFGGLVNFQFSSLRANSETNLEFGGSHPYDPCGDRIEVERESCLLESSSQISPQMEPFCGKKKATCQDDSKNFISLMEFLSDKKRKGQ